MLLADMKVPQRITHFARLRDVDDPVRFFCDTARSRIRRAVLPIFAALCAALGALKLSPSLALPYFNLVFRKREG